jgi:short-subunit dehydrogenase
MPLHNVYSASKVFVDYLSRALSYENRGKIDIISLRPS